MGFFILVHTKIPNIDKFYLGNVLTESLLNYMCERYYMEDIPDDYEILKCAHKYLLCYHWPKLPHDSNFYLTKHCPENTDEYVIVSNIFVSEHLRSHEQSNWIPMSVYFMSCLSNFYDEVNKNCDLKTSIAYMYCCTFIIYYSYLRTTGIKVSRTNSKFVFSTLSHYASIENVYDDVYANMSIHMIKHPEFKEYFVKYNNNVKSYNLMMCESLLAAYEGSGIVFRFFKGSFLAKCIAMLATDEFANSISIKLCILSHIYRNKYITYKESNRWIIKDFNGAWIRRDGTSELARSISSVRNFVKDLVSEACLAASRVTSIEYNDGLNVLYECVNKASTCSALKSYLVVNDYTVMISNYNRTLKFEDCVYDLNTRSVRQHQPHDISPNTIPYCFYHSKHLEAEMELDRILDEYFNDKTIIDYIYQIFGRSLSGNPYDKGLWIFIGDTNAGKSKFMELVKMAFGSYADILSGNYFVRQSKTGDATTDINKVVGKLIGIVQEPRKGKIDVEAIKEKTGDIQINVRKLYHEAETVENTVRYVICANDIDLNTYDSALWSRIYVVKFERMFIDESLYNEYKMSMTPKELDKYRVRDPNIDKVFKMVAPILMSRFIRAFHQSEGKTMYHPKRVLEDTKELRAKCDDTTKFLNECVSVVNDDQCTIEITELYGWFKRWYEYTKADFKNLITLDNFKRAIISNGYIVKDRIIVKIVYKVEFTNSLLMEPSTTINIPNRTLIEW